MATSPDGSTVVSAGADETLRFWRCFGDPPAVAKEDKGAGVAGSGVALGGGANRLRSIR